MINFILAGSMAVLFVCSDSWAPMSARASTVNDVQGQIDQHTNALNNANDRIVALETEQEILQEQIDDLNAEIVNTMTSIGMMEDEIAEKEAEIDAKTAEITEKEEQIVQTQIQIQKTEEEYNEAVLREENQRENMAVCARLIYERGDDSYLDALLGGKGLADILNKMDRVERVYDYENTVLLEYIEVKNQVHDLWDRLEEEKAGLESDKAVLEADRNTLEADRTQLESDRAVLQSQKASLNSMLAKKKQESANYDAEIKQARQDAANAKALLKQDQARLKALQAAQNGGGASSGGGGGSVSPPASSTTNYTSAINSAAGSDLGKQIANYACQYIGNPYVPGGTSLTGGADCSGFTYRVYSDFGYSLPRTSYMQRSAGTGVSYDSAQPGDLICYDGHVALYIGGGLIVHASNSSPYPSGGIKVSQAQYRSILAVRRIVN